MKRFIIGVTGASGVCYAKRLFDILQPQAELHVIISERGGELLKLELDLTSKYFAKEDVTVYRNSKINSSVASGSFP
ncbi:MAG: flavoprotein, partial [Nitrospinaceae bacterium]